MAHVFSRPTRAGIAGRAGQSFHAGAAPHLPAGILSPYSDGERSALIEASPIISVTECPPRSPPAPTPLA
ncbi:hypothetical protein EOA88_40290, partial [Mesorhizobium sp. M5C.F.Ca.IN.020.14.1.1]